MKKNASHLVLAEFKKKFNSDRKVEGTFISFLDKLIKKKKEYITISNSEEVNNLKKIFKVFDTVSIFIDNSEEKLFTSSILEDLNKSEELKCITWVIYTYNLKSHSILPTIIQIKPTATKSKRKCKRSLSPILLSPLINAVVNKKKMVLLILVEGNSVQIQINILT